MELKHKKRITKKLWISMALITVFGLGSLVLYVAKCGLGLLSITWYDPFCYICINSTIRNFPTIGIIGESEYRTWAEYQDGPDPSPASIYLKFDTSETPDAIRRKATEYLNVQGFKEVKSSIYQGGNFVKYETEFKDTKSQIFLKIEESHEGYKTHASVGQDFFSELYKDE